MAEKLSANTGNCAAIVDEADTLISKLNDLVPPQTSVCSSSASETSTVVESPIGSRHSSLRLEVLEQISSCLSNLLSKATDNVTEETRFGKQLVAPPANIIIRNILCRLMDSLAEMRSCLQLSVTDAISTLIDTCFTKLACLVAELAKDEEQRAALGSVSLNPSAHRLIDHLATILCPKGVSIERESGIDAGADSPSSRGRDRFIAALRAFGNFCADNEANRSLVATRKCVPMAFATIIGRLTSCRLGPIPDPDLDDLAHVCTIVSIATYNIIVDHNDCQRAFLSIAESTYPIISGLMDIVLCLGNLGYRHAAQLALRAINCVARTCEDGCLSILAQWPNPGLKLAHMLVEGFDQEENEEFYNELIALFESLAERSPEFRAGFADCAYVVDAAKTIKDRDLHKKFANVVAVCLYKTSTLNPATLPTVLQWLSSGTWTFLRCAGAIGVGNYVRDDKSSEAMASQEGVITALLKQVGSKELEEIHAGLQALKNLCIASCNKMVLLRAGILDALIPCLSSENPDVIYLACGCLRLLAHNHDEGKKVLISSAELKENLKTFSLPESDFIKQMFREQIKNVKIEMGRLFSNLMKADTKPETYDDFLSSELCLSYVFGLFGSPHAQLKLEASLGLAILCTRQNIFACSAISEFASTSEYFLDALENGGEPVASNILVMFNELSKMQLLSVFKSNNKDRILKALKKISSSTDLKIVQLAGNLIDQLNA